MPGMMSSAAAPVEIIPGHRENHSGIGRKRSPSARNLVRLQPGILFVFTPESFSRSPRNPVRLAPESPDMPGKIAAESSAKPGCIL